MEVLWWVGVGTLLYFLYLIVNFVLTNFVLTSYDLSKYGAGKGGWALVTGSSDGIGKCYAEELAKEGFNLILVSRTESKLRELGSKLSEQYKIKTDVVAVDVSSQETDKIFAKIKESLDQHPINVLVNNVGVGTSLPSKLSDMKDEEIADQLQVNMVFPTKLTKLCLPYLKKNKNPRSAILNLSSISYLLPGAPYISVYAATKAYNAVFSRALTVELKAEGVDVLCVAPGYVMTAMSKFRRTSTFIRSPEDIVKATWPHLGRVSEASPFWSHHLFRIATVSAPPSLMIQSATNQMEAARKKLLNRPSS
jgi:17beta-estradiol 17-dehydrogenase / very-long-chain 3-oxoacyl-CoA reductase